MVAFEPGARRRLFHRAQGRDRTRLRLTPSAATDLAVLSARRQSVGALRALGAPRAFVFVAVWLQGAFLIAAGVVSGLGLGVVLARAIGAYAATELGFDADATIGIPELAFAASLLAAGSLFAAA